MQWIVGCEAGDDRVVGDKGTGRGKKEGEGEPYFLRSRYDNQLG
jgi:hypothetical protein